MNTNAWGRGWSTLRKFFSRGNFVGPSVDPLPESSSLFCTQFEDMQMGGSGTNSPRGPWALRQAASLVNSFLTAAML